MICFLTISRSPLIKEVYEIFPSPDPKLSNDDLQELTGKLSKEAMYCHHYNTKRQRKRRAIITKLKHLAYSSFLSCQVLG